jgi:hypothetical protein
MKPFRTVLAWLCCALVLALGLPRSATPCEAGTTATAASPGTDGGSGCCGTAQCCCTDAAAMMDCGCNDPDRGPAPQPPAPRQPLPDARAERQPMPQPPATPEADRLPPPRAANDTVAAAPLPHRTRQEALSVWRL